MKDKIETPENFDDGITHVAPKGQFKAINKEEDLKLERLIAEAVDRTRQETKQAILKKIDDAFADILNLIELEKLNNYGKEDFFIKLRRLIEAHKKEIQNEC